jgi:hypothetical protein
MKTRTLRTAGLLLLAALLGVVAYWQWGGEPPPSAAKKRGAKGRGADLLANARAESPALPAAGFSSDRAQPTAVKKRKVKPLTETEKETITTAITKLYANLASVAVTNWPYDTSNGKTSEFRSETEEIEMAGRALSGLLQEFEPGSPAWKEARRQGEEMLQRVAKIRMTHRARATRDLEQRVKDLEEYFNSAAGAQARNPPPAAEKPTPADGAKSPSQL